MGEHEKYDDAYLRLECIKMAQSMSVQFQKWEDISELAEEIYEFVAPVPERE